MDISDRPFRPPSWLRNPHVQTIAGAYLPGLDFPYRAVRHEVVLPDGDRVILHDDCPSGWRAGERCVLMLHGVGGCHRSPYLVRLAGKLHALNVRSFRLDQRGCGASAATARGPGHAGRSGDVAAAIAQIASLTEHSPLALIGFSLGGNLVLKLLGEWSDQPAPTVDRAFAVAPPIDLKACAHNLERGSNHWYSRAFASRLMRLVEQRLVENDGFPVPPPAPKRVRHLVEFDEWFTAPLSGFADVWDYYRRCSSAPLLRQIRVPTTVLVAVDDPLIPVEIFRRAEYSHTVRVIDTPYGGHMGYLGQAGIDPDRRWMEWRIVEWVTGERS